jgi:hypothetical protein
MADAVTSWCSCIVSSSNFIPQQVLHALESESVGGPSTCRRKLLHRDQTVGRFMLHFNSYLLEAYTSQRQQLRVLVFWITQKSYLRLQKVAQSSWQLGIL